MAAGLDPRQPFVASDAAVAAKDEKPPLIINTVVQNYITKHLEVNAASSAPAGRDLPPCHPGPGWWKKQGVEMPKTVQAKRNWRARKAR